MNTQDRFAQLEKIKQERALKEAFEDFIKLITKYQKLDRQAGRGCCGPTLAGIYAVFYEFGLDNDEVRNRMQKESIKEVTPLQKAYLKMLGEKSESRHKVKERLVPLESKVNLLGKPHTRSYGMKSALEPYDPRDEMNQAIQDFLQEFVDDPKKLESDQIDNLKQKTKQLEKQFSASSGVEKEDCEIGGSIMRNFRNFIVTKEIMLLCLRKFAQKNDYRGYSGKAVVDFLKENVWSKLMLRHPDYSEPYFPRFLSKKDFKSDDEKALFLETRSYWALYARGVRMALEIVDAKKHRGIPEPVPVRNHLNILSPKRLR